MQNHPHSISFFQPSAPLWHPHAFLHPGVPLAPLLLRFIYLICQAIRSAMSVLHHPWNGNLCDTNITLPAFLQLFALFMFSHSFSFYLSVFSKTTFEEQILVYSKTEWDKQRFLIYPMLPHMDTLLHY